MLRVLLGGTDEKKVRSSRYFEYNYVVGIIDQSWIEDDFIKRMILDVDKSEVIGGGVIKSPVLGIRYYDSIKAI